MIARDLLTVLGYCQGEVLVKGKLGTEVKNISTDSRSLKQDALFFALRGENFDGHQFLEVVLKKGVAGVVIDKRFQQSADYSFFMNLTKEVECGVVVVEDVKRALGDVAKNYLAEFSPKIVAVTGSNGKTTTRGIITTLLTAKYSVVATVGNFNNDIGLPLTVFNYEGEEVLLLEMGMNHQGELARLVEIAPPDIAVITNVGDAHIEFFADKQAIAAAKKEIFSLFGDDSVAVINADDEYKDFLADGVPGEKLFFSGMAEGFEVVEDLGLNGYRLQFIGESVKLFSLGGEFNLYNLAAAVAVARKLGLSESVIGDRISLVENVGARTQIVKGHCTIFNDSYNANPSSMRSALELLGKESSSVGRRIALLGDMLELGTASKDIHYKLGKWIAENKVVDDLLLYGEMMSHCGDGALAAGFKKDYLLSSMNKEKIELWLKKNIHSEDSLLLKGSRGMKLESFLKVVGFNN